MKFKKLMLVTPSVLYILFFLLVWEILVSIWQTNSRILPPPSSILQVIYSHWDILLPHVLQTLLEASIGFVVASIIGFLLTILIDINPHIRSSIYPILIISQSVPIIALAPLLLLWFGFGLLPKIIVVTLYCFFPIVIAGTDGLTKTEIEFSKLLRSMNATYWQGLWFVRLPKSMPSFFAGLKIAATYSVTGAIVGEFVGAYQGLGVFMQRAANSYSVNYVFAGILITVFLSLLIFRIVIFLEHIFLIRN